MNIADDHIDFRNLNIKHKQFTLVESQVLQYLIKGCRPKEIAYETGRSVHTINSHVANIKNKLD